ncbi:hypothetical protein T440DRAFT_494127 [Plenodomus tracheiphilus IPT5]|uniref:Uncharacterized protein n=1 Tax=Plenodomus tracheiphilus IPT5 TaxID=1408161 RepID=A0A6A7AMH1_9PLEO|nr:hypothetical protein T440DRAFT_494127 [Plenodomus tracheiphilus IPT5]
MGKARQALARGVPPGVCDSYRALADHSGVALEYLTPWEESTLVKFILQMSDLGQPVRIKYISSLAFVATSTRTPTDRPPILRRNPETAARRIMALDEHCYETNIAGQMTHWFEVIQRVLRHTAILA